MTHYEDMVMAVAEHGEERTDRTGTGTMSLFGMTSFFPLHEGRVPLISSKKVAWEKALKEHLWMLRGEHNTAGLEDAANIWEPWADETGDLGPVYGKQWRRWAGKGDEEIDQLARVIDLLRESPDTRRAVLSNWAVHELNEMALEPCPIMYHFSRRGENYEYLAMTVYQRSADLFLGVPFDLFEFGVMAHLVARELGIKAISLQYMIGDVHIYGDHVDAVGQMIDQYNELVTENEEYEADPWPRIIIAEDAPSMLSNELTVDHFQVEGYEPKPSIKAPVSV